MTPPNSIPPAAQDKTGFVPSLGLLPAVVISAAVAGPAAAQTTQTTQEPIVLETIEITSQTDGEAATDYRVTSGSSPKMTAPLVDTPKTVTVITQRQMEERNATSVVEVLRTTPGITLGSGEGGTPMGDRPFVRGYQAATDMMIDGIRNLGRTSQEAFATESVEVVKGPGGAYSGRGATGGSINLVSKQARQGETFHELSETLGSADHTRLTYDGNVDFGDGWAGRLNLMWQDSGVAGRDVLQDDREGIAASVSKSFGTSLLSLNLYHSKTDATPDLGVPMGNGDYRPELSGGRRFGSGTKSDPWLPIELADKSAFYGSALRDYREVENNSAMLKFEHEFSNNFKLHSTLAWIGSEQEYIMSRPSVVAEMVSPGRGQPPEPNPNWDPDANLANRDLRSGKKKNSALAFHTALTGDFDTGSVKHDFAAGIELSREKLRSATATGSPSIPVTDIANPNPYDPVTGSLTWSAWGTPIQTDTKALYLFDTLTFNDQWSLNLGLRYDRYEVDDGTRSRTDNMLNYSAGVVYKPAPNGTIYLAFGTSSNPSGECAGMAGGADGASACTLGDGNVNLEPEESKSIELGTKWEVMDGQLLLTAAVFQTEKKNARVNDEFGTVALLGHNRARGFELGAAGQISDRWGLSAGYAFVDAKIIDNGFTGGGAAGDGVPSADNGNYLQFVARHSLGLWTTYEIDERWTVGGGATYTGKRYLDTSNTSALPAQWRVDLMAAYKLTESAEIQFNVNNVLDERLYDASHVGIFANRAPGRNVTAKLNYRF
ncbi:TonB-dependent receptor [Paracoccus alkenifer]|uniref:Catecholate siderophore receptor n=1 Tax=Paracoccus alkenifer TaxID=65735 RepID=A0A1H6NCI0_9RHOB|nr:TonB-dependent siderophore receptor [Paracoccus alkenifer]SEI12700.1 catecholate siderophore receptor [Paracoccus alkenifer]